MKAVPRTARVELEGGIHHVTLRGNRGGPIFLDDHDRTFLLDELRDTAADYAWTWLAYCLMTNHAHLVIETPRRTLGVGMRRLASSHAQRFNLRHGFYGHVFQGRYGSVLVRSDAQLAQLLRYVALNPVKAGLAGDPAAWRWSSHRALLDGSSPVRVARRRVEALLEVWGGPAGSRYARLFDPEGTLAREFGDRSPWEPSRPTLAELLSGAELDDALYAARRHGYRLSEIATAAGLHESTVSRRARRAS